MPSNIQSFRTFPTLEQKPAEHSSEHDLMSLDPKVIAVREYGLSSLMKPATDLTKTPEILTPKKPSQLISIDIGPGQCTEDKANQLKKTIKSWNEEIANIRKLIGHLPEDKDTTDTDLLETSEDMLRSIEKRLDSLDSTNGYIAIYNKDGTIEALGIYSKNSNQYTLDYLVTAPKNLQLRKLPDSIQAVRGAGSLVVEHVVCMALRDRTQIVALESLGTEKFYERLGFEKKEGSLFTFQLETNRLESRAAAHRILDPAT